MIYKHDISNAFENKIGTSGTSQSHFGITLKETETAIEVLRRHKQDGSWPLLSLPESGFELETIEKYARYIKDNFSTLIVIGMGGSSRGGKTLVALTENNFAQSVGTKILFIDNIDPHTSDQMLSSVDLKTTLFLIISKSGDTAETLTHMLVLMREVATKLSKDAIKKHFLAIAMPGDNTLRRIAASYDISVIDHDPGIGGRFSVLTSVGLLPAQVAGVDSTAVRAGAAAVIQDLFTSKDPEPAKGAALHHALYERGKTIPVIMPYCDRLDIFSTWYQQVWAESLGKRGKGTTPLRALGAFDQHSQLQLFLDGPRDKFMTLILLAQAGKGAKIPAPKEASLSYLENRTVGDVIDAEQRATAETLAHYCPVRLFTLPELSAESMGALMMHFMLETMIMAELWHINAFDQPAVEEGKRLAREYLTKTK
jgi:glucose-6-phosphate isomerase